MLIWGDGKPGRLVIAEGRAWVDLTFSTFFHYKACGGGKGKGKKRKVRERVRVVERENVLLGRGNRSEK